MVYKNTPFPNARHVHMEYLQYAVEAGLIGLVLIMNVINSFFNKVATNKTELCLKACVLGFLVSCCFNYPTRLWLPALWAMFFYSAFQRKDTQWG